MLDTDSTGPGTGKYMTYGITAGNPATSDVITGATSTATCILTSGVPDFTGVIWQGKCQNQEFVGTGNVLTIGGSTVSSSAHKSITTVAGASFRDNANAQTNALRYNALNGAAIRGTSNALQTVLVTGEAFVETSNLQIAAVGTDSVGLDHIAAGNCIVSNCIIEGTYVSASFDAGVLALSTPYTVKNTVIILRASAAHHIVGAGADTGSWYNCTIVAPDDLATAPTSIFFGGAFGTATVNNCGLFAGDSTKAIKAGSVTFNFTTCYSDISGTAGVTQATYGNEFQSVLDATRDFRLKAGAAQINVGTTDATNAATDIVGTLRPQGAAYDVGAWEAPPLTVLMPQSSC